MGDLRRIDELTSPPIIGQRYLVPTVCGSWYGRVGRFPVVGPRHDDAEHLDFKLDHFHIDVRFIGPRQGHGAISYYSAHRSDPLAFACASSPIHNLTERQARWEPWTCRRVSHEYPLPDALKLARFRRLFDAYAGRRCGRGANGVLICPHKGAPLSSLPTKDGKVVCPLHGPTIDVETGRVVPPLEEAPHAESAPPANDNRPRPSARVEDLERLRERCRLANLAAVRVLGLESVQPLPGHRS